MVFIWELKENLKEYLESACKALENVQLIFPPDAKKETLYKLVGCADIIVGWRPTQEMLRRATQLQLFINPGAGVQHLIDLFRETRRDRSITLVNGHGNTYFAAQHAVALLLALMNKVIPHHNWMVSGTWRTGDDDAISIPLRDRVVGLLGYGAVNQKVHKFLSPYSVEFAICKRDWHQERGAFPDCIRCYNPETLDAFFKYVDIAVIAVPLTAKTRSMINASHLALLGATGLLVNIARGPVVCEEDLYNALKNGVIAGAALDVWYDYQPQTDEHNRRYPYHYPFHVLDNVLLSPHRAASPFNDLKRWDEVIENISRFACHRHDFLNVVDLNREY